MKEIILNSVISEVRASYGNKRAPPRPYLVLARPSSSDADRRGRTRKDGEGRGKIRKEGEV